jgi:hypothetical protein
MLTPWRGGFVRVVRSQALCWWFAFGGTLRVALQHGSVHQDLNEGLRLRPGDRSEPDDVVVFALDAEPPRVAQERASKPAGDRPRD